MINKQNSRKPAFTLERKANLIAHGIIDMFIAVIYLVYFLTLRLAVFKRKLLVISANSKILTLDWFLYVFAIIILVAGLANLLSAIMKKAETEVNAEKVLAEGYYKKTLVKSCILGVFILILVPLVAILMSELVKLGNMEAISFVAILFGLVIMTCLTNGIKAILNCVFEKCLEERMLLQIMEERKAKEREENKVQEQQN